MKWKRRMLPRMPGWRKEKNGHAGEQIHIWCTLAAEAVVKLLPVRRSQQNKVIKYYIYNSVNIRKYIILVYNRDYYIILI